MGYYTRPDVYVEELSSAEGPVRSAQTGRGGMQAITYKGPVGVPIRTRNFEAWKKIFGGYEERSDAAYEAESFFKEGGFELITVRQAHYADLSDKTSVAGAASFRMHQTAGVAATPATKTSLVGPFNIRSGGDVNFTFEVGGSGSLTAEVTATYGAILCTSSEGTDQDGRTLDISVDSGPVQTITLAGAAITFQEIINQVNAQIIGASCVAGPGSAPYIISDTLGSSSSIHLVGGDSTLTWDTSSMDGTGNVADDSAVTATEMKALLDAIPTFTTYGVAQVNVDGSFTISSVDTGAAVALEFTDANTTFGFSVETLNGTDDGATFPTLKVSAGYHGYLSPGLSGDLLKTKAVPNPLVPSGGAGHDLAANITIGDTAIQVESISGINENTVLTVSDGTHTEQKIVSGTRTEISGSTISYFVDVSSAFTYGYTDGSTTIHSNEFDLYIYEGTQEVERWEGLSMLDTADNYVETIVNDESIGSVYVVVEDQNAVPPGVGLDTPAEDTAAVSLAGGADETSGIIDLDWVGLESGGTGLYAWDTVNEFMPFCTVGNISPIVVHMAALYAKSRIYMEYLTYLSAGLSGSAAVSYRNNTLGVNSDCTSLYAGGIQVFDPVGSGSNPRRSIAGIGAMMGIRARVDSLPGDGGGPWEAPAGEGDYGTVNYALDVATEYKDSETGGMNEAGINVIRKFGSTNPVTVWGCRTLSTDPNKRFLYINVRRFFQFVEKSIADSTRWAVHRNNNYKLWAKLTDRGDDFLSSLLVRGAFPTRVKELAFFIDVGTANGVMTQEDIDAGRVKGRIGMAANKPGEFLIWEFTQYDSGWAISE